MVAPADSELEDPRSARELLGQTSGVYRSCPLHFLTLAAAVIVPYLLLVLPITGDGLFEAQDNFSFVFRELVDLFALALVWPLISALHVHAVRDIVDGGRPRLRHVARRGLLSRR